MWHYSFPTSKINSLSIKYLKYFYLITFYFVSEFDFLIFLVIVTLKSFVLI